MLADLNENKALLWC